MHCIIMQGVPGSGKSTLTRLLAEAYNATVCSTDEFHVNDKGEYEWKIEHAHDAHEKCFQKFWMALDRKIGTVIVDNTNTRRWEAQRYIKLAKQFGYTLQVICVTSQFQNVHGVPEADVQAMRRRFEHLTHEDIK